MGGALTGRPSARIVVEIVGLSNTTPTSLMRPPHLSHLSTSILKVRLRSCGVNNEDIFLGYAGSLSGVQDTAIPQAQTEFVNEFARNPIAWITHNTP